MTTSTDAAGGLDTRLEILRFVSRQLMGPSDGPTEVLRDSPLTRYGMGILFPRELQDAGALAEDEETAQSGDDVDEEGENSDETIRHASKWLPASCGLSFYTDAPRVEVLVHGATYLEEEGAEQKVWQRVELATPDQPDARVFETSRYGDEQQVLQDRALLRVVSRPLNGGYLVTVTLLNAREPRDAAAEHADPDDCLFQVGLRCIPRDGAILEYPSAGTTLLDKEEQELRLVYRHHRSFGVGHGCSVSWDESENGTAGEIRNTFLPFHEVPALTTVVGGPSEVLRLAYLSDHDVPTTELVTKLRAFAREYHDWIENLPGQHLDIPTGLEDAKHRLLDRLSQAAKRIDEGIDVLERDPVALRIFRLSNRAMLAQMTHGKVARDRTNSSRYEGPRTSEVMLDTSRTWRPFQLAFFLLSLPSIHDREHGDRSLVDLIWFPTGGGKTEAYLAVTAYLVLRRRLVDGARGAGTVVLTRYTLRLLTAQQFQRAAILICALEWMRRAEPGVYGHEPITIGLWAGREVSPNSCVAAKEKLEAVMGLDRPDNPFVLETCPWCGTAILPSKRTGDAADYGVRAATQSFQFYCPNDHCNFHDLLPVQVVDEELYREPPTFLVGTVDKFAQLAWNARPGAFFGGEDAGVDPPELIIQDELHLISGPLGTVVGLYESGILSLITARGGKPKVISSTATIRRAHEQSAELFGRAVALFPPSGLSADDSYFSRKDVTRRGRLYVGLMSPNLSYKSAIVHLITALMQAPRHVPMDEGEQDSYSTLVAYHNTLRDLGQSLNLARDDVPARLKVLWPIDEERRQLDDQEILELTSNVGGQKLTRLLGRLERAPTHGDFVSILATTNMISVGVDVPRLGLMTIVGQPKTTSEYIQASSRVGRADIPGIVTVLYSTSKARDRSHYETFPTFHQSLYQYVEPTTVTPFSLQARRRALHAAYVILVRHGVPGMGANESAKLFSPKDPRFHGARNLLLEWVGAADRNEHRATEMQLDDLIETWGLMAKKARETDRGLYYEAKGKQHEALLTQFGEKEGIWETLNSMRNVDTESVVEVLGA